MRLGVGSLSKTSAMFALGAPDVLCCIRRGFAGLVLCLPGGQTAKCWRRKSLAQCVSVTVRCSLHDGEGICQLEF